MENGFKIYHAGDTGVFGDMGLIGELYKPDLALLPIGGHFTMGPEDAAFATNRLLKPRFVIPAHYGTFPVLAGTPQQYIKALGNSSTRVIVPQPGEKVEF
jgi:L-ascorbate metabolism protein UlaG (beta-lactamase superfamily)